MSTNAMTPEQVRTIGLRALAEALGPDGVVRILVQFSAGSGDYTAARQAWVDSLDLDTILRALDRRHSSQDQLPKRDVAT